MGLTSDVAAEREALDDLALGRDAFARRA